MPEEYEQVEFMSGLCEAWLGRIQKAKEAKQEFSDIAEQCYGFYSKTSGFMWQPKFKGKFLSKVDAPKFTVTLQKAFEFVSLYGPMLFWKYPNFHVVTEEPVELTEQLLSDSGLVLRLAGLDSRYEALGEEFIGQVKESILAERQSEIARSEARNSLMQKYLNYAQREQPQGLEMHADLAIIDALVKGRGCLWCEPYHYEGDEDRELTGLFFDPVENFLVDPDCEDALLEGAGWIARRRYNRIDVMQELYPDVPREAWKQSAAFESGNSQGSKINHRHNSKRKSGQLHDTVVWYQIWSKCGAGCVGEDDNPLTQAFDEVVGKYAYLCVAPGIPYPLNAPKNSIIKETDDQVSERFAWPVPYWRDNRWPVVTLDFYRDPNSPWPIAPLAPALGELICLNILASAFIEQAYDNRKQIIAYLSSASTTLEAALKGSASPALVEINDNAHKSINEVMQYLNRPNMNTDLIQAIEYVSQLFDKRTGLTEIMYAMNTGGTQSRTAADVQEKSERASIRPDKMAKDVAKWISHGGTISMFAARWNVEGQSLVPMLGKFGARLWDILVTEEDPEVFVREMKCHVEANDLRKPNKAREAENLSSMMQVLVPELSKHADVTGDTGPLNSYIKAYGRAIEQDVADFEMGPRSPGPEAMQAAQEQAELEKQKLQADVEKSQADIALKEMDLQIKQIDAQVAMATGGVEIEKAQAELQIQGAEASQKLQIDQAMAAQALQQKHEIGILEIMQRRTEGAEKIAQMREQGELKVSLAEQQARIKARNAQKSGSKT